MLGGRPQQGDAQRPTKPAETTSQPQAAQVTNQPPTGSAVDETEEVDDLPF